MTSSTNQLPDGILDDLVAELDLEGEGPRRALTKLLEATIAALGANESSILRPVGSENLEFFVSTNERILEENIIIPIRDSIAGVVFLTGQTMAHDEAKGQNPIVDEKLGYSTNEYLAVPIIKSDQVVGVLTFVNRPEGSGPFTKPEIQFAEMVAECCEPLLGHAEEVRRHIENTGDTLRQIFGSEGVGAGGAERASDDAFSMSIRAEITTMLRTLDENDLDLVRDIVERFSGQTSGLSE